jgi:hypothetical protein
LIRAREDIGARIKVRIVDRIRGQYLRRFDLTFLGVRHINMLHSLPSSTGHDIARIKHPVTAVVRKEVKEWKTSECR